MKKKLYKIPISVLVVIYTKQSSILLLHRADRKNYWQSVTGSIEKKETLIEAARREVYEETGINTNEYFLHDWKLNHQYEIYKHWRHRYEPNITHNIEHIFGLEIPLKTLIKLSPSEHIEYEWVNIEDAKKKVFSWTNVIALEKLHEIQTLKR
ncbi:dihydroneopterin triphosphate diphosphatase [Methylophilaceae bacterium]|nr:dihydroneopterin triphosphate diphosphatase [Methylophilaceae bacterium]MDB4138337.1 dihydroneopterin triphosphate diphosphatase [Methylophilaceae bacterium]